MNKYDHLTTTDGFCRVAAWPTCQVATGEVFLGAEAKSKGLVDRLATSDEVRCFQGGKFGDPETTGVSVDSQSLRIQTLQKYMIYTGNPWKS